MDMKKKLVTRGLLGLPIGVAIGFLIPLFISLLIGDGNFYPVTPELAARMGSELNATLIQTGLCAAMGAGCDMVSVIWEIERWSIVRQTGVYFLALSLILLPVAYWMGWMPHDLRGMAIYFGYFAGIFLVVWLIQYFGWRARIRRLNARMRRETEKE